MPDVAATRAICDAAYAILDAATGLAGLGEKERAEPWQDADLPKWTVAWEDEQITPLSGGENECDCMLVFIAHAQGDGAASKADKLRTAAQKAIMADGRLGGIVTRIRPTAADPDRDDGGRAVTGSIRLMFRVKYETNRDGILLT